MTIALRDITKVYQTGGRELPVLKGISFSIADGELCAIMGPSGSGKSTLMNVIGCLDTPTDGEYLLDGEDVAALADDELALVRNRKNRLRLPELQPRQTHHHARQRAAADALRRRRGESPRDAGAQRHQTDHDPGC